MRGFQISLLLPQAELNHVNKYLRGERWRNVSQARLGNALKQAGIFGKTCLSRNPLVAVLAHSRRSMREAWCSFSPLLISRGDHCKRFSSIRDYASMVYSLRGVIFEINAELGGCSHFSLPRKGRRFVGSLSFICVFANLCVWVSVLLKKNEQMKTLPRSWGSAAFRWWSVSLPAKRKVAKQTKINNGYNRAIT